MSDIKQIVDEKFKSATNEIVSRVPSVEQRLSKLEDEAGIGSWWENHPRYRISPRLTEEEIAAFKAQKCGGGE